MTARCEPTDDRHCRVLLTAELNGTVLQSEERVWNLNEETLLPPRQSRRLTRAAVKKCPTSTKN